MIIKAFHKLFNVSHTASVGLLALSLLATTAALAQNDQPLPFPQAANPAVVNGHLYLPLVVETNHKAATPEAMASGEAGRHASVLDWHHNVKLGPANEPTPGLGDSTPADNLELGSPFPMAANPSR